MVFTPLLTSACVGTLEFRSVAVPVMSIQKHLKDPQNSYFLGSAQNVDPKKKVVHCIDEDGTKYDVSYDKLVIATGSQVCYTTLIFTVYSFLTFTAMLCGGYKIPNIVSSDVAGQHLWHTWCRQILSSSARHLRCQQHQKSAYSQLEQS